MKTEYSNYYVNGEAQDHEWLVHNFEMFCSYVRDEMRNNGYIPVLDIPMTFTGDYNAEMTLYKFQVTAKGQKVGRKKSRNYLGIMAKEGILVGLDANSVELATA